MSYFQKEFLDKFLQIKFLKESLKFPKESADNCMQEELLKDFHQQFLEQYLGIGGDIYDEIR